MSRKSASFRTRLQGLEQFFREYTRGLRTRDVKHLFERDAANAFAVLIREHAKGPEPEGGFHRFFFRARLLFLGLSYKLSPPRRLLFAAAMVALVLGCFFKLQLRLLRGHVNISINFSGVWFLLAAGALLFLLILELVDRIRVRDELEVARQLQADLLPKELPLVPGYRFAHCYQTANEVGGDSYDVTQLPDGRLALLVADASGHGMAAGLVMAIANVTWNRPRPRPRPPTPNESSSS
jgi:sigma-B regulation protein RsbU (phosphoserine phosphatase)